MLTLTKQIRFLQQCAVLRRYKLYKKLHFGLTLTRCSTVGE